MLLYLTMRFAKTIKQIQGLQAYHTGDKLNVEVDLVLDEATTLRDSHDLGESLQYVLESVPSGESRHHCLTLLLSDLLTIFACLQLTERLCIWITRATICPVICSKTRRKSLARSRVNGRGFVASLMRYSELGPFGDVRDDTLLRYMSVQLECTNIRYTERI